MSIPLAPVTGKVMRVGRGGRAECWGAVTADGVWGIERTEEPGTPWEVYHLVSVRARLLTRPVLLLGTMRACRAGIAAGRAQAELDRLLAHDRGEHAERDSYCIAC